MPTLCIVYSTLRDTKIPYMERWQTFEARALKWLNLIARCSFFYFLSEKKPKVLFY